jgi:hypothetical protein
MRIRPALVAAVSLALGLWLGWRAVRAVPADVDWRDAPHTFAGMVRGDFGEVRGGELDPVALSLVRRHFPDTATVWLPADVLVFSEIRILAEAESSEGRVRFIRVVRVRPNMPSPRGQTTLVMVDESGREMRELGERFDVRDGRLTYYGEPAFDLRERADVDAAWALDRTAEDDLFGRLFPDASGP